MSAIQYVEKAAVLQNTVRRHPSPPRNHQKVGLIAISGLLTMCAYGYDSLPFDELEVGPGVAGAAAGGFSPLPLSGGSISATGGSTGITAGSNGGTSSGQGGTLPVSGGTSGSQGGGPPGSSGGVQQSAGGIAAISGGAGGATGGTGGAGGAPSIGGTSAVGGASNTGGSGTGGSGTGGSGTGGSGTGGSSAGGSGTGGSSAGGSGTGGSGGAAPSGPPVFSWSKLYANGASADTFSSAVCLDSNSNVQVGGTFIGAINFGGGNISATGSGLDGFIASYGPTGTYRFATHSTLTNDDGIYGLAPTATGTAFTFNISKNTLTFGAFSVATGTKGGAAVGVMDANGTPLWMKGAVLSTATLADTNTHGVTVGASGKVYLYGSHDSNLTVDGQLLTTTTGAGSGYFAIFDSAGTRVAANTLAGYEWRNLLEGSNALYAIGSTYGNPGNAAIATYTLGGVYSSIATWGGAKDDVIMDAARDASGNIYIVGYFGNTINFGGANLTAIGTSDIFVASFTSSLVHRWSMRFGSNAADAGSAIALDPSGNVYIAGTQQGAINFGGGNQGSDSLFLASFTSGGVYRWAQSYDGGTNSIDSVSVAPDFSIYLAGGVVLPTDFLGTILQSTGVPSAGYLVKLTPTP